MNILQSFYDGFAGENRLWWTLWTPLIVGAFFALIGGWRRWHSLAQWRLDQECPVRPWLKSLMFVQVFFVALLFAANLSATTLTDALRQDNLGKLGLGLLGALFLSGLAIEFLKKYSK